MANNEKLNICYVSGNLDECRNLIAFFQKFFGENGARVRIIPAVFPHRAVEVGNTHAIDAFIIDHALIGNDTSAVLEEVKSKVTKPESKGAMFIATTMNTEPLLVTTMLKVGWDDVMIHPVDRDMLAQKLSDAFASKELHTPEEVVITRGSLSASIAMPFAIERFSSFGCSLVMDRPMWAGEVIALGGKAFDLSEHREVAARCIKSEAHPTKPGMFLVKFRLAGVEPRLTLQLRRSAVGQHSRG